MNTRSFSVTLAGGPTACRFPAWLRGVSGEAGLLSDDGGIIGLPLDEDPAPICVLGSVV